MYSYVACVKRTPSKSNVYFLLPNLFAVCNEHLRSRQMASTKIYWWAIWIVDAFNILERSKKTSEQFIHAQRCMNNETCLVGYYWPVTESLETETNFRLSCAFFETLGKTEIIQSKASRVNALLRPVATYLNRLNLCAPAICTVILCKQTNQTVRIGLQAMLPYFPFFNAYKCTWSRQCKYHSFYVPVCLCVRTKTCVFQDKCKREAFQTVDIEDWAQFLKSINCERPEIIVTLYFFTDFNLYSNQEILTVEHESLTALKCLFRFENSNRIVGAAGNHIPGVAPIAAVHLVLVPDQIEKRCPRTGRKVEMEIVNFSLWNVKAVGNLPSHVPKFDAIIVGARYE